MDRGNRYESPRGVVMFRLWACEPQKGTAFVSLWGEERFRSQLGISGMAVTWFEIDEFWPEFARSGPFRSPTL